MDKSQKDDGNLSEQHAALLSAVKTLTELLAVISPNARQHLIHAFGTQRDSFLQKEMPIAAGLMEHLRLFLDDPKRQADQQAASALAKTPTQGSA